MVLRDCVWAVGLCETVCSRDTERILGAVESSHVAFEDQKLFSRLQ